MRSWVVGNMLFSLIHIDGKKRVWVIFNYCLWAKVLFVAQLECAAYGSEEPAMHNLYNLPV